MIDAWTTSALAIRRSGSVFRLGDVLRRIGRDDVAPIPRQVSMLIGQFRLAMRRHKGKHRAEIELAEKL